jgi:hypothetical protein
VLVADFHGARVVAFSDTGEYRFSVSTGQVNDCIMNPYTGKAIVSLETVTQMKQFDVNDPTHTLSTLATATFTRTHFNAFIGPHLYVLHYEGRELHRFDAISGAFIDIFATKLGAYSFAVSQGPDGVIYVAYRGGIHRFDVNGTRLSNLTMPEVNYFSTHLIVKVSQNSCSLAEPAA